jgi:hypothetical protein
VKGFFFLWVSLVAAQARAAPPERITLYTPVFQGEAQLAKSVAASINLQLWQASRAAPVVHGATPNTLGVIVWGQHPLETFGHEQAEHRAEQLAILAQFVYWGKVYEYGDGAIVESNLTIPRYNDFRAVHPEIWALALLPDMPPIEADIPQRRYSFRAMTLAKALVARYSDPASLEILDKSVGGKVIGRLGNEFDHIGQVGDSAEIISNGVRGWLPLSALPAAHEPSVNFVIGVMQAFRDDWSGVREKMNLVLKVPDIPNELRTDAYLYLGLANEKQRRSGAEQFEAAVSLSPNARRCILYEEMALLSQFQREQRAGERRALLKRARQLLIDSQVLFPRSDEWPSHVIEQLDVLLGRAP